MAKKPAKRSLVKITMGRLGPVPHQTVVKSFRVLVQRTKEYYIIYMGDNATRTLTEAELPAALKSTFAMIRACKDHDLVMVHDPFIETAAFPFNNTTYPPEFNDIGWRLTQSWYVVVMDRKLFNYLRGMQDDEDDAGEQDQSEGQEST